MRTIEEKTRDCLKTLKEKYDLIHLSIAKIVGVVLEWDEKEETDENGRTWYIETHWSHQRPDSRKLSPGDIIKFKANRGEGIMVVGSFDFESDFAARSYYMFEDHLSEDGKTTFKIVGNSYAPGLCEFSFATDEEIADFFKKVKEHGKFELSNETVFDFYFNSDFTPEEIKSKIAKYIE